MSTITVTNTNDSGSGSLRDALAQAQNGDAIAFSSNLANKKIVLTSGQLIAKKNVTIDGSGAANLIVSGNNVSRVLSTAFATNVTLKNLTIADGSTSFVTGTSLGKGGGVNVGASSIFTVINCNFKDNTASKAGAINASTKCKVTVIDCNFENNNGTVAKNGFSAGAISCEMSGSLTVKGSKFTGNRGIVGGAIYTQLTALTIEDSIFTKNRSWSGGGAIYTDGANGAGPNPKSNTVGGTVRISGSWFENNDTQGAGGALNLYIYNPDQAIVENTTIIGNKAAANYKGMAEGGGLRANGNVTVRNVSFINNISERQGGGMWIDGDRTSNNATVNIENTTFSGNEAVSDKGRGGAITINPPASTTVNIHNSTIVNNYAENSAGALWVVGKQVVTLTNSIIANNTADDLTGSAQQVIYQLRDGGGNIEYPAPQNSRSVKVTANALITDPKLGSLQKIDGVFVHPLLAGSPAIDAGVGSSLATDERGFTRDSKPDIGAFEFDPTKTGSGVRKAISPNSGTKLNEVTSGNDVIIGTAKGDRIVGLGGRDILTGGGGNDQFIYTNMRDKGDRITDFEIGKDKLVFTKLLDSLGYVGTDAIADNYVKVVQGISPSKFSVQIDVDGSTGKEIFKPFISVNVIGTETLNNPSNFVF